MRLKSVMEHGFSMIPDVKLGRSRFNRSHGYKTTFDSGYLIPIYVDEALPGDTFNLKMTAFARLATPLKPIMDNMYMDSFFFAVPIRLIWDNWKKLMGEQINPGDSTEFFVPKMVAPVGGHLVGSLSDYLGIPTGIAGLEHSSLWHRAYNLIYNEWFRDENLINSLVVDKDDGPDTSTDYVLKRRCKRHDYFTSCLPWLQKGSAVEIPLGTVAPVISDGTQPWINNGISDKALGAVINTSFIAVQGGDWGASANAEWGKAGDNTFTGLQADLSTATAATINALRQAMQLQKLYERDARGGTRYIEIIRSHFGVVSPDARMQRSEYLGGGSTPVNINPVAQTADTGAGTPQGNLAGIGTATAQNGFVKSFTEHCVLIGMVNVRADLTYQQGLDRMFSRRTRWDFYWPELSCIGEQAVLNKEIYAKNDANDDLAFGYQERYAEYRYKQSKITGKFRSTYATPLDMWHLSQEFGALPTLGETFIQENPPVDRVVAVNTEPQFIFDSYFDLNCVRPMPVFSAPGVMTRF